MSTKRRARKSKRQPLKRTRLNRHGEGLSKDNLIRNSTLPRVGKKMREKLSGAGGYVAFSRAVRRNRPDCEIRWEVCTGRSQGVHHVIKRSHGGALTPGDLADRQGQEFVSACNRCNREIENQPAPSNRRGLVEAKTRSASRVWDAG